MSIKRGVHLFHSAIAVVFVFSCQPAGSTEADRLNQMVGKICPATLATYKLPGPTEYCGADNCGSLDLKCTDARIQCLDELWNVQRSVERYNRWIEKCRSAEQEKRDAENHAMQNSSLPPDKQSDHEKTSLFGDMLKKQKQRSANADAENDQLRREAKEIGQRNLQTNVNKCHAWSNSCRSQCGGWASDYVIACVGWCAKEGDACTLLVSGQDSSVAQQKADLARVNLGRVIQQGRQRELRRRLEEQQEQAQTELANTLSAAIGAMSSSGQRSYQPPISYGSSYSGGYSYHGSANSPFPQFGTGGTGSAYAPPVNVTPSLGGHSSCAPGWGSCGTR